MSPHELAVGSLVRVRGSLESGSAFCSCSQLLSCRLLHLLPDEGAAAWAVSSTRPCDRSTSGASSINIRVSILKQLFFHEWLAPMVLIQEKSPLKMFGN